MSRIIATIMFLLFFFPFATPADIIHVPGDQPTIQAGIDAAVNGDTVLVADGTYTGPGNRDIDFGGKAIIVKSEHGAASCVIDCAGSEGDPHRGFIFQSGEGEDSVMDGFSIRNGYLDGSEQDSGGAGISCENASPTIRYNIITGNASHKDDYETGSGGGIYCKNAWPVISGNTITGNLSMYKGGGIFCSEYSSPTIVGNIITGNLSTYKGGGIFCYYYSDPVIDHNVISANESSSEGGGIGCDQFVSATITNNLITDNTATWGGGVSCKSYSSPEISDNILTGNTALHGGAIYCEARCAPMIIGNTIDRNSAYYGGAIYLYHYCSATINDNIISRNEAGYFDGGLGDAAVNGKSEGRGGGIYCYSSSVSMANNLISHNRSEGIGGGIYFFVESNPTMINNTLFGNRATEQGGGIYCAAECALTISNTIHWNNTAPEGKEIYLGTSSDPASITIRYADVEGGQASVFVDTGCSLTWGPGMIDADPIFSTGPLGDYYLSQIAAGQTEDSACIDAGDPAGDMISGTTRTDSVQDTGIVDMGYHYPIYTPYYYLLAGPGSSYTNPPAVRVFPPEQNGSHQYEFNAYGASRFGVNVMCGDVDRDGVDEILTGPGPGNIYGPHVRGFQVNGLPLSGLSFLAYGTRKFGVNVSAGDLDNDGFDEIITGAGPGAVFGPHVRAFNFDGAPPVTPVPGVSYFAYGTRQWGVNVAAGDIDGDSFDEIITGAGPGPVFGPHVRGWDVDGGTASTIPAVSYFAYSTRKWGVAVTCGNVDGDGFDEIVTAPGPSWFFAAHLRGWNFDNSSISALPGLSFFAWPSAEARYGAKVFSGADLNEDSRDEIVAGCGPDPSVGTPVKVFLYDGSQVTEWFSLQAFPSGWTHGTNVAAGRF